MTAAERAALARLEVRERAYKRGSTLVREHDKAGELFILRRGTMMSYVLLDDGSRQILRFLYPGDILAQTSLVFSRSPETIVALSDSLVSPFDRSALASLVVAHPRLAAAMLALDQMERVALTDRLTGIGRTSAKARIASLLIEIRNRVHLGNPADDTFILGLTQEEIGDATGLTSVHVNRMLRQLEEEGLIAREAGRIHFRDEPALMRAANYVDRLDGLNLDWLPPAP